MVQLLHKPSLFFLIFFSFLQILFPVERMAATESEDTHSFFYSSFLVWFARQDEMNRNLERKYSRLDTRFWIVNAGH